MSDYNIIKISPQKQNIEDGEYINLYIPPRCYDLKFAQFNIQLNDVQVSTDADYLVYYRNQCFPINECMVILDGETIGRYQNLMIAQISKNQKKIKGQIIPDNTQINLFDYSLAGISTAGQDVDLQISFKLKDFLPGCFYKKRYLRVQNLMTIKFRMGNFNICPLRCKQSALNFYDIYQENDVLYSQTTQKSYEGWENRVQNINMTLNMKECNIEDKIPLSYYQQTIQRPSCNVTEDLTNKISLFQDIAIVRSNGYDIVPDNNTDLKNVIISRNGKILINQDNDSHQSLAQQFSLFQKIIFNNCIARLEDQFQGQQLNFNCSSNQENTFHDFVIGIQYFKK